MSVKWKQERILIIATLLSLVCMALGFGYLPFAIDMSRNKDYLLSAYSKKTVRNLGEPLAITYYLSGSLQRMDPFSAEIIDLLEQYARDSRGKISVTVVDPSKKGIAGQVEKLGITPKTVQYSGSEANYETVYSGICLEYLNRFDVLPFVSSLSTLEYDLTVRINSLVSGAPRELGILVATGDKKYDVDFTYLSSYLGKAGYSPYQINLSEPLPDDLSLLFIFGGERELSAEKLQEVDAFIHRGGKVLFALDGVFVDSANSLKATPVTDSLLIEMLTSYGVTVEPSLVLDLANISIPFETTDPAGGTKTELVPYPHWLALLERFSSRTHPVAKGFSGLDLFWASPLSIAAKPGLDYEPIASTTPSSWRMTEHFATQLDAEDQFYAQEYATQGQYVLALSVAGIFPPYFAEPSASIASRIIVVGDSEFSTGLMEYSRSERNLEFLVLAADWLSGNEALMNVRGKVIQNTRLDKIVDADENKRAVAGIKILNLVVLPVLILLCALFLWWRRKSRR